MLAEAVALVEDLAAGRTAAVFADDFLASTTLEVVDFLSAVDLLADAVVFPAAGFVDAVFAAAALGAALEEADLEEEILAADVLTAGALEDEVLEDEVLEEVEDLVFDAD